MPDERQDSIRQGIQAPAESPAGQDAAEQRRQRAAEGPPIGGAMGGTSDAERPGEESQMNAAMADDAPDRATLAETREASQRAQGGGIADEADIDRAARGGRQQ